MLKAIGLSGTNVSGETVVERVPGLGEAELIDTLKGLLMSGYVLSDKSSFRDLDDVKRADFHVNSGYAKELREAIEPERQPAKRSRRVRRE